LLSEKTKDLFMQTLIERFVRGEFGVTAYGLIAAALMLIGVGTWVIAAVPRHVVASPQINPLEMMANAKSLATPLPMAQNAPATFVPSPPAGGATGNPAAPGPNPQTGTRSHYGTKHHHRKIYLSANSTHKHKHLKPAATVRVAFPDLTHRSGADNVY
jgi:Flp pilus assembly pilin Flp